MHRDRRAVDRARPNRHAGYPVRAQNVLGAVLERHGDRRAIVLDIGLDFVLAEPDRAAPLPRQRGV